MSEQDAHISNRDLLMAADGELTPRRAAEVRAHLAACWECRTRTGEIEGAIADFIGINRGLDPQLPPAEGSRALLKARLSELAAGSRPPMAVLFPAWRWAYIGAAVVFVVLGALILQPRRILGELRSVPDPALTPGAVFLASSADLCAEPDPDRVRLIPAHLARQVFSKYGIDSPPPRAFEVDYLITPALGGSDDIRNFWPQPYSATVWNAHVKDALEDHLRALVCSGRLDLASAQRDIAQDWIAAYKKYFHTDKPLSGHLAYAKDQPWE